MGRPRGGSGHGFGTFLLRYLPAISTFIYSINQMFCVCPVLGKGQANENRYGVCLIGEWESHIYNIYIYILCIYAK
jgi:hypothetical protein